ncbi:hypothetical protein CYQ88_03370 [Hydrogenovibrio sp. SC-1]|uniref:type II toxin -antitoxin system TacA 1-like antitoxin n=1 Tax=Hydrogenovibrio sp. SC-1 TaxID=2065820 RepID=UPI000C7E6E5F|nr:DUF1778 domain-containing protein [Hydrogenovibrio sp. SC-1]PLA74952.1 hypothetical protein CYQ88_03370 [Hydrogenovibrio sp. SC-1]
MTKLDFQLSDQETEILSLAAAIEGVSISDFVVSAALGKANEALDPNSATRIKSEDVPAIAEAVFEPNSISPEIIQTMKELQTFEGKFSL